MVFVRHAAVYGIGAMALVLKEMFKQCTEDSLQVLYDSLNVPRGPEDEEVYKATKDNTASAIGKVIKSTWAVHSEDVLKQLINKWITLLPLKADKVEAVIMHEFLLDLLEKQKTIVLNQKENLEKVLKVIAAIWKTKSSNDVLNARMTALLQAWMADPQLQAAMNDVKLSEKQQGWIKKCLEGK
jgi:hypothetical protein